ncbi:MAG: efflux RND transporter periplasmic adaptor subunit [bacterium]
MKNIILILIMTILVGGCGKPSATEPASHDEAIVTRGPLSVWTPCDGTLEARRVETILSQFQGRATLIELITEGSHVQRGDLLARLDASQLETDLVKLKSEYARTEAELDALQNATIPLERQDFEVQLNDLNYQYDTEKQILVDTRELVERKLVSRREIAQQELKLASLEAKASQIEQHRKLAETHLHPAKLTQARAAVDAARQQLLLAQQQFSNCVVTAPSDGLAVYLPLHVGNEFRALRVGDTLYPNQPFLCIPDMSEFIIPCFIPESDLSRVRIGQSALVTPLAYPDLHLTATVESVGIMAQTQPGYPVWQKYFRVVIRIDQLDGRLRPGMSLHVEVCSYTQPAAILIPRSAVQWDQGKGSCRVRTLRGFEHRPLKLGWSDTRFHEVLEGVVVGDKLIQP